MILVVDTSTLLDLEGVGGIPILPKLGQPVHALDVVLAECGDKLARRIRAAGYLEVAVAESWVPDARRLKTAALSLIDALVLHYAKTNDGLLIASDGSLRKRATQYGVEVHGAIWVAEQALAGKLIGPDELCAWLNGWTVTARCLPQDEIDRLRKVLACK